MKTVLSIDVGIRNLALCVMTYNDTSEYIIDYWEVINTIEDESDKKCQNEQKNGKICNKKCGYKYTNNCNLVYSCKTHFPKNITIDKMKNIVKKKIIKNYLLQDIAKKVLFQINCVYEKNKEVFEKINQIVIELQPKVNSSMKFTSHIIYGKLTELYQDKPTTIRFVRASQKLKAYTGPRIECKLKGVYAQRKWLSIQYGQWFLENKFSQEQRDKWLPSLTGKLDDRFDTFLMAINTISGIPKKQKMNFKKK